MKKYINNSTTIRNLIIPINIILIVLVLFRWINYDESSIVDITSMSITFIVVCVLFDFMFFYLKSLMYNTKYNGEKIIQRYILHEKHIFYKEVKTILLVGNVIVLCKDIVDLNKLSKKGNLLRKYFSNDIMFYLGSSDSILNVISNNINCGAYIINSTPGSKARFENYFNVIN